MRLIAKFTSALALALLISCGSDDSSSGKKLLSGMVMTSDNNLYNNNYTFTYDNKNRLKHMSRTGAANIEAEFHYENGNKTSSVSLSGDIEGELVLGYDSQKRLTSYQLNANPAGSIVYSGDNFAISSVTGSLDSKANLKTFSTLAFNYDDSKKGPMANVNGFDALLFALLESNMPYFYSKYTCVSLVNSDDANASFSMAYTFGSENFPIQCEVTSGVYDATLVYTYTN